MSSLSHTGGAKEQQKPPLKEEHKEGSTALGGGFLLQGKVYAACEDIHLSMPLRSFLAWRDAFFEGQRKAQAATQ